MIVEGRYRFPGAREVIWDLLLDPGVIAKSIPGTEAMVLVAPGRYEGKMRVGVGSLTAAEFDVSVTLADVVAPEHYTMLIDGRGRLGFTRGSARVRLEPNGAGTVMHYTADLEVGGTVAAVGHRLLDSLSRMMAKQGLEAMSREVGARLASGKGTAPGPGAGPVSGGPGSEPGAGPGSEPQPRPGSGPAAGPAAGSGAP